MPFRFFSDASTAFEVTVYYKPGLVFNNGFDETHTDIISSCVIIGGPNMYFGKRYKANKQKIKLNGISVKGGVGFGDFKTYSIAISWLHESFFENSKKHSFTFELGPGFVITEYVDEYKGYSNKTFFLNIKIQWNWFDQ